MTSFPRSAKIVFIGAGSMSFGLAMLRDIFQTQRWRAARYPCRRERRRSATHDEARRGLEPGGGPELTIAHTTDRRRALAGADFVVNSIAVDRLRQWKLDFEVPRKYGIRHTLGENGGPGALFFTLRTLPIIFDIVRDMEELCPQALFIKLSNPESRIVLALPNIAASAPLASATASSWRTRTWPAFWAWPPRRLWCGRQASIIFSGCCRFASARPAKTFIRCCAKRRRRPRTVRSR